MTSSQYVHTEVRNKDKIGCDLPKASQRVSAGAQLVLGFLILSIYPGSGGRQAQRLMRNRARPKGLTAWRSSMESNPSFHGD